MKRIAFVAVVLLVGACGEAPLPTENGDFQPFMSVTQSSTRQMLPFEVFAFAPCGNGGAGELIHVMGQLSASSKTVVGPSGNVSSQTHFRMHHVRGRGMSSGNAYRNVSATTQRLNTSDALTSTLVNTYHLIGHGSAPDYHVHETSHVTINANGELVVDRLETRATCK